MAAVQDKDHQTEGGLLVGAGVQDDVDEEEICAFVFVSKSVFVQVQIIKLKENCWLVSKMMWMKMGLVRLLCMYTIYMSYGSSTFTLNSPDPDCLLVTVLESQRIGLLHCFMNPVCF